MKILWGLLLLFFACNSALLHALSYDSGIVANPSVGVQTNNSTTTFTGGITFTKGLTVTGGDTTLPSGTKLYLDGGSDTYITESGANTMDFFSGGTLSFRITLSGNTSQVAVRFSTGTALLPGLTFSGDTNTGIWSPSGDTVSGTTGGIEKFRVDTATFSISNVNFRVVSGYTELYDRTIAQIRAITPGKTGQQYNCTDCATTPVCVSTGASIAAFSALDNKTAVCQ